MVEPVLECPVCHKTTLKITETELDIPYFGKAMIYNATCENCGYKINDIKFEGNYPVKDKIKIEKPEDLNIKIVRGNRGTIRIPELGLSMEPGPLAESFITNVEGLFERFLNVLPLFDPEKTKELEEKINDAKNGKMKFTVIIEDPTGVSHFVREI